MNSPDKCQEMKELFPLYYNGGLEQVQIDALQLHLESCPDCRESYTREKVLFAVAGSDAAANLDSHPDADLLDNYALDPDTLTDSQRSEIEAHLADCAICREMVEKLQSLPNKLDDLVPADSLPLITELDRSAGASAKTNHITDLTRRLWKPLTAIAAAAMIIIVGVTMVSFEGSDQSARLEATFPAITRTASAPTVFETESESFIFAGRLYVDPEENHDYSILIRDLGSDSTIFESLDKINFDSIGFALLDVAMTPGNYELVLWDIIGTDSLSITHRFEIHLNR